MGLARNLEPPLKISSSVHRARNMSLGSIWAQTRLQPMESFCKIPNPKPQNTVPWVSPALDLSQGSTRLKLHVQPRKTLSMGSGGRGAGCFQLFPCRLYRVTETVIQTHLPRDMTSVNSLPGSVCAPGSSHTSDTTVTCGDLNTKRQRKMSPF